MRQQGVARLKSVCRRSMVCPVQLVLQVQLESQDPTKEVRSQAWDSAQAEPRGTLCIKRSSLSQKWPVVVSSGNSGEKDTENREEKQTPPGTIKLAGSQLMECLKSVFAAMDGQELSGVSFVLGASKSAVPNTEALLTFRGGHSHPGEWRITYSSHPLSRVVCSQSVLSKTSKHHMKQEA